MLDESKTADSDMMIIVMGDADMNQCGGRMWRALRVGGVYVIDGVLSGWNYVVRCARSGQARVYRGRNIDRQNERRTKG